MKCYYCGARLNRTNTCPSCRKNVYVWKRAKYISNFLYNDGLELAKRRDFTGAVESLETSLQYDKRNTQARNLLGLIYYEMGEWYDACAQWNISLSFVPDDNAASAYLDEMMKSSLLMEQENQAIRKYNQCLHYCKQKNYDLAQIQLRKVFELNPNFLKGYQLAALLQMREGQYDEAMLLLKKAARIDRRNPDTRSYINECRKHLGKDGKPDETERIKPRSVKELFLEFQDKLVLSAVTNIAIGVAAGLAVFGFLIMPAMKQHDASQTSRDLVAANEAASQGEQRISSLESQIDDLQADLEAERKKSKKGEKRIAAYEHLVAAADALQLKRYADAGEELGMVDVSLLDEASQDSYQTIQRALEAQQSREARAAADAADSAPAADGDGTE